MAKHEHSRGIPLARGWPRRVKSAMLHVVALAQHAAAYTRSWAINGRIARVRLNAENGHLRQQVALLTEEIRRLREGERPSAVIRAYGLCRTTIYRWLRAAQRGGEPR